VCVCVCIARFKHYRPFNPILVCKVKSIKVTVLLWRKEKIICIMLLSNNIFKIVYRINTFLQFAVHVMCTECNKWNHKRFNTIRDKLVTHIGFQCRCRYIELV